MGFKTWADSRYRRLTFVGNQLTQIGAAALLLTIAKLWPPLLSLEWYWYDIIFVLAVIRPAYQILKK